MDQTAWEGDGSAHPRVDHAQTPASPALSSNKQAQFGPAGAVTDASAAPPTDPLDNPASEEWNNPVWKIAYFPMRNSS